MPERVRIVLQARLSSSRLPGKALLPIGGLPMVVLAAQRAARAGFDIVVATSLEPEDDAIAAIVQDEGIACVRGSLNDPLARFLQATSDLDDDAWVVRLTGDNVLVDSQVVADLLADRQRRGIDYIRTGGGEGNTPYGLGVEVFPVRMLRQSPTADPRAYNHEHVTPWIRQTAGDCPVDPPGSDPRWAGRRATVDTLDDYERVRRAFAGVADPIGASWTEIVARLPEANRVKVRRPNSIGQGALVLGAVQIGLPYGIANERGLPSDAEARSLLSAAADVGVTHLDTARAYGVSEERIGESLRRGLSERVGVVTKVRPLDVPADAPPEWARAAVDLSVSESLRALQVDRVAALLLHRASDRHAGGGAVGRRLVELQESGTCSLVGVSVSSPTELCEVLAEPWCGYVQLPFNLLDHRWLAPAVQDALAARPEVVVTVRSVYLQGLLAGGDAVQWPAVTGLTIERVHQVRTALAELVTAYGRKGIRDLALSYVLSHPWVTSVVVGADGADQLRENVGFLGAALDEAQLAEVRARLHPVPEALLDPAQWPGDLLTED